MGKIKRVTGKRMPHLRAWRDSLGLSRQAVADRIGQLSPETPAPDQATIAKWEGGSVRSEDLELLAQVYNVTVDRLFFPPDDEHTPARLREAHEIIISADPKALAAWLETGKALKRKKAD